MMWRIAFVVGAGLALGGCASSSGVASAPAKQPATRPVVNASMSAGKFAYVYYPEIEAYFSPDRGRWFWVDPQDGWRFDTELPADMKARRGAGIQMNLDCEHPNDRHAAVATAYPATGMQRGSSQVTGGN